jgi:hypothetical protein
VSASLHELGKLAKLQGRCDDARRYLEEEQGVLVRLLEGRGGAAGSQEGLLLQGRITGMCYLRTIARELGDRDAMLAHSASIKQLKSRLQQVGGPTTLTTMKLHVRVDPSQGGGLDGLCGVNGVGPAPAATDSFYARRCRTDFLK